MQGLKAHGRRAIVHILERTSVLQKFTPVRHRADGGYGRFTMKKRLLSLLLAVCMVATLFSGLTVNASAAGILDSASDRLKSYFDTELLEELDLETLDVGAILTAAATTETSGDFGAEGNNLHWNVEDGVLTITGSGEM